MRLQLRALLATAVSAALLQGCAGLSAIGSCSAVYAWRPPAGDAPAAIERTPFCPPAASGGAGGEGAASAIAAVSASAGMTAPLFPRSGPYADALEMIESADMSAFMSRVRTDFLAGENSGAWGYAVIDAIAGDDAALAARIIAAMEKESDPETLSAAHLKPWVMAFAQEPGAAAEMAKLGRILPAATLLGHRALLAEGLGDIEGALAIYEEAPTGFDRPDPSEAGSPAFLARAVAFNSRRLLALRHAELLRSAGRKDMAVALLEALLQAAPDDGYAQGRLEAARGDRDKRPLRTLKQAMALAISDEADLVEERQSIMAMVMARGAEPPFNYRIASMRQSALLLDPDNGELRVSEVSELYRQGKFEAALRMAQIGRPPVEFRAQLLSFAGLSALELGDRAVASALIEESLRRDPSDEARIAAAGSLVNAGDAARAIALIDQTIRNLTPSEQARALIIRGQALYHLGDIDGAVGAAREAYGLRPDEGASQFLASMLVKSPARPEGLDIMRDMLMSSPGDVGLMNNLGYSLIESFATPAELDEGYRILKQASRIAPDEANLLDSLGWAYYLYGDFKEAKRFIDLAIKAYQPFRNWELFDHLGDVLWRLGDEAGARQAWRDAVAAVPPLAARARTEAKLADGLTAPPPERRAPPEVPLSRTRPERNEI
jgi:tetratricopeptide (TPR) repeat protein